MNKKGLTLVELLAVIAIIGILSVMIAPTFMWIRNKVLESTYQTRVLQIESAAKEYATDHINLIPSVIKESEVLSQEDITKEVYKTKDYDCCATISVNYLLSSGYLAPTNSHVTDGEDQIINPITGESMNNNVLCIRFTTNDVLSREIIAYILP